MEDNSTPTGAEDFNTQHKDTITTALEDLVDTGLVQEDGKTFHSEFETKLFSEGKLKFDPEKHCKTILEQARTRDEIKQQYLQSKDSSLSQKAIDEQFVTDRLLMEALWEEKFQDRIPQRWSDEKNIRNDLIALGDFKSENRKEQVLSQDLVNALCAHPNPQIAELVAKKIKLSEEQLTKVLARDIQDPVEFGMFMMKVPRYQYKMWGGDEKDKGKRIKHAQRIASKLRKSAKKKSLDDKLQLQGFRALFDNIPQETGEEKDSIALLTKKIGELPSGQIPSVYWPGNSNGNGVKNKSFLDRFRN